MENAALWSQLAEQSRNGELYLDDARAAYECAKACDQYIDELGNLLRTSRDTQNVSGFGDFDMARDLERKFLKQATGEDTSVDKVITDSIEVVKDMRAVMASSFRRLTGQEVENAAAVYTAGQGG
jgi:hypothetical protein